jgi:hypothetical protein
MRAVIPLLQDGAVLGVLYIDTAGAPISSEQLHEAQRVADAEASRLG